jgi:FkbM family methyltransferase
MTPPQTSASPNATRSLSKRDFLVGMAAGGCFLQAGKWGASALAKPTAAAPPDSPRPYHVGYAQSGEDILVQVIFDYLKQPIPTYLDIGAFEPVTMNNTYLFYALGARGVLVEPNPDLTAKLTETRPGDTVLAVGIGTSGVHEELDFYRLSEPSWNTFSKEQAEHCVKVSGGKVTIQEVVKTPLVPINEVCARHFPSGEPDFLSVDVEGLDLQILRTLDFDKHRPKVICVETIETGTNRERVETGQFLATKGYVARGGSFFNTVFVDKKLIG